ncbi:MAG: hypothetical protein ABSB78_05600 [Bacteroidota bacterium]
MRTKQKINWTTYLTLAVLTVYFSLLIYLLIRLGQEIRPFNISLSSEAISAIIGLLGVIVGVFLTNFYNEQKEKSKNKRVLITEFIDLNYEIQIHLHKIQEAAANQQDEKLKELLLLNLKINNQLERFNVKCWDIFKSVWVKAAISRLVHSYIIITEQVIEKRPIDQSLIKTSLFWIENQTSEILPLLMKNASIPTKTGNKPVFVGFRNVTAIDKEKLKFEYERPPWEPHIIFDYTHNPSPDIANNIYEANIGKIKNLKCKVHGFAPHLILSGYSINHKLLISIVGCCDDLVKETKQRI